MNTHLRRDALFAYPSFLCSGGRRMTTAARGIGTSAYNFVQGSETFVHPSTIFHQEPTTMAQFFAKTSNFPPMAVFLFFIYTVTSYFLRQLGLYIAVNKKL